MLDQIEQVGFTRRGEGNRQAFAAGPAGTADPVDIAVRIQRQIIVEDMGNPFNVQTPGGNVRCNQELQLGIAEPFHDRFAFALGQIAMQLVAVIAGCLQRFVQL
ncbi:hypothetical protein D3C75_795250 [compost metagenome]